MSFFISTTRMMKFALQNFFRNFWLSFITMTIFLLTLITVNTVLIMNVVADTALESVEQKVEVSVYFTPEASEDLVKSVQGYLLGLSQVRDVMFTQADDALAAFKEQNADNPVILESLEEVEGNPIGHALIISAHSPEDFPFILEAVDTPEYAPFVKEKDFTDYETVIANINALSAKIRIGGVILASFFGLVAILIIFNTIRVAIYVHRDEIGIMKLVGANDWFVRGPFLLEALLYSFIATIIIIVLIFGGMNVLDPWIAGYFGDVDISLRNYFFENGLLIFGIEFLVLSLLSLLTTAFAMRRYLRV
jgi:cell division transport system permease protein